MPVVASLVAALVGAVCYGVASVMQAIAARAASHRPAPGDDGGVAAGGVDPGLIVRMLGQWRFLVSLGLDMVGFIAQLVALQRLPLFAVQAIVACDLAVTAVFAAWLIHVRLSAREWLAVGGVMAGIAMLGLSAGPEGAAHPGVVFKLGLIAAVAGLALLGMAAGRLPDRLRTPLLGVIAGIGYGVLAIAARVLNGFAPLGLIRDPATYALIAAAIVSFLFYASALEGGSVTVATASLVLAETLPPAAVGVVFLGDGTRRGLGGVAIAGFVLAVVCAVALARFGEARHDPPDADSADTPPPWRQRDGQRTARGRQAGNAALPGRRLLSWWPVDRRIDRRVVDHGSPWWPHHRITPGPFTPGISSSPEEWPPALARGSPHPASASC